MLNEHITEFIPNYEQYQIDPYEEQNKYDFSLTGVCILKPITEKNMNFTLSLRICININAVSDINVKIEDIISVELIKIKIH
jgi:hypothetical protein